MKNTAKKIMKSVAAAALAASMAVSLTACAGGTNYAKDNTKIVIGAAGPLTGPAAIYGIAVKNCAEMAIEEINAAGGLNGIEFELNMVDDKHDPSTIANAYATLYEGGMQVSLGTVTTKPGLEFKAYAKDDNVLFMTPSATGDGIPEFDNGFQMCFADSDQGTASAKYFNENYAGKSVGVFYKADDDYSKGIYEKFKAALDASFSLAEASFTGDASSFDSQIALLKDCDVIFMPIYYTPAAQFMTQGKDTVKADAIYYGCDGLDGIDAVEGFDINSITQEVSYLSHFNSNASEGPAKEFIDKYNEKYDEAKEPLNQFGAAAYDCVYALYEAMKVATENGKTIEANIAPSEMTEILKEVLTNGSFEFNGITGKTTATEKSTISWSADGKVQKEAIAYTVKEVTK